MQQFIYLCIHCVRNHCENYVRTQLIPLKNNIVHAHTHILLNIIERNMNRYLYRFYQYSRAEISMKILEKLDSKLSRHNWYSF